MSCAHTQTCARFPRRNADSGASAAPPSSRAQRRRPAAAARRAVAPPRPAPHWCPRPGATPRATAARWRGTPPPHIVAAATRGPAAPPSHTAADTSRTAAPCTFRTRIRGRSPLLPSTRRTSKAPPVAPTPSCATNARAAPLAPRPHHGSGRARRRKSASAPFPRASLCALLLRRRRQLARGVAKAVAREEAAPLRASSLLAACVSQSQRLAVYAIGDTASAMFEIAVFIGAFPIFKFSPLSPLTLRPLRRPTSLPLTFSTFPNFPLYTSILQTAAVFTLRNQLSCYNTSSCFHRRSLRRPTRYCRHLCQQLPFNANSPIRNRVAQKRNATALRQTSHRFL